MGGGEASRLRRLDQVAGCGASAAPRRWSWLCAEARFLAPARKTLLIKVSSRGFDARCPLDARLSPGGSDRRLAIPEATCDSSETVGAGLRSVPVGLPARAKEQHLSGSADVVLPGGLG
jgi:hypothetical protein